MIPIWSRWTRRGGAVLAAAFLASCSGPPQLRVDEAWVRMPAVPGRPGAAYFTLHGGPAPATLIGVTSDLSLRSEMHESMAGGMKAIPSITVPAGGEVTFAPGGRHVMLFGVNPHARKGVTFLLTFTFADGSRLTRNAVSVAAADPVPSVD